MAESPHPPLFFRLLIPGFSTSFSIPVAFYNKYLAEVGCEKVMLRSKRRRKGLEVRLVGRRLVNGWKEFVAEHELKVGNFLIFRLEGDGFWVSLFGKSEAEVEYQPVDEDEDVDGEINMKMKMDLCYTGGARKSSQGGVRLTSKKTSLQHLRESFYNVFVDNIPDNRDERWLRPLFNRDGNVLDVFIQAKERRATRTRFGFVRYENIHEAKAAIKRLDGCHVGGGKLKVMLADKGGKPSPKRQNQRLEKTLNQWELLKEMKQNRVWKPKNREEDQPPQDGSVPFNQKLSNLETTTRLGLRFEGDQEALLQHLISHRTETVLPLRRNLSVQKQEMQLVESEFYMYQRRSSLTRDVPEQSHREERMKFKDWIQIKSPSKERKGLSSS